jgi:hypothetical protein
MSHAGARAMRKHKAGACIGGHQQQSGDTLAGFDRYGQRFRRGRHYLLAFELCGGWRVA